ncbi:hypothetical protein AALD01_02415 [Oscillospiraceae bacterium 21-37]
MTTIGFVPAHASMDSALLICESDYESIESALVDLLDAAGNKDIVVYDSSELSAEILENRLGQTVVERCIGIVKDADTGEGILLNTEDPNFNFISYRGVYRPISNGSVVLSYMVYSSYNNSVDDIVERYDFVIK